MSWGKTRIFKVTVSLVLALGASYFIGEKVFIPGTMVVNPEVKKNIFFLPGKGAKLPSRFADLLKRIPIPGFPTPGPATPGQPAPSQGPVTTPTAQPTQPPGTPSPTPGVIPTPYYPPVTPTPIPTPTPTPTITPTPTPSGVTIEAFAKCLTSRGMKMYGVDGCSACQYQKSMFGAAFTYIDYINCEQQAQLCSQKGIGAYPTWENSSGSLYRGAQLFSSLSYISGCPVPS